MKKRFVVLIESTSKEQNDEFLKWVKEEGIGWWHWFQDAWLLADPNAHLSASEIRDKLKDCFGNANTLVLELRDYNDTWAGYGPNTSDKDMFRWLHKNWKGE